MPTPAVVWEAFTRVEPRFVAVALLFQLANIALRSLAWRNVLRAAYPGRVPYFGVAGAYSAGMALNAFMPARGGDLVKIALARTRIRGSSVPTIAASMGVVTLFDAVLGSLVILVLAVAGLLPAFPGLPSLPAAPGLVAGHPVAAAVAAALLAGAAVVAGRRFTPRLRSAWAQLKAGASILRSPRRYATEVVPAQLAAWACRIGAAYFLLAAFGVPATVAAAVIVVVAGGLATVLPTPGGIGTQQVLLAYLLHATASTAAIVSFSLGMQATVTTLNLCIGLAAAMLMLRTLRPAGALRAHVRALRAETVA